MAETVDVQGFFGVLSLLSRVFQIFFKLDFRVGSFLGCNPWQ
jgi:hypothetical protein